ncbi:hypothetical protein BC829DRAFT_408206 [Chytridium lagenaria]|nr:hypothetical protein BC829DRAFT_408206 [Chytridium lagenaria]
MMFANALQGIPNVDTLPTPTDIKPKPPRLSSIGGSMSLTRNLSRLSNPSDAFTTQKLRPNKHLLGREFEESDDDDVVDFDVKGGWKLNKPERAEVTRDFIGERGDELSVDAGDTVIVRVVFDDGWGFGTNVRTKKVGVFPVFWIRPLEEDSMIAGGFDDCC